jgi:hypothetical protein
MKRRGKEQGSERRTDEVKEGRKAIRTELKRKESKRRR